MTDNFQKSGLDVLFFGQDQYDTLAVIQKDVKQEEIKRLMD